MGLADDAVTGYEWRTPPAPKPIKPKPVPEWQFEAATYADSTFTDLIHAYVEHELRVRHEIDWTLAALWWGVHR